MDPSHLTNMRVGVSFTLSRSMSTPFPCAVCWWVLKACRRVNYHLSSSLQLCDQAHLSFFSMYNARNVDCRPPFSKHELSMCAMTMSRIVMQPVVLSRRLCLLDTRDSVIRSQFSQLADNLSPLSNKGHPSISHRVRDLQIWPRLRFPA